MAKNPKNVSMCVGDAGETRPAATAPFADEPSESFDASEGDGVIEAFEARAAFAAGGMPEAAPAVFFAAIKSHSFPEVRRRPQIRPGSPETPAMHAGAGRAKRRFRKAKHAEPPRRSPQAGRTEAEAETHQTGERRTRPMRPLYHREKAVRTEPRKGSSARFPTVGKAKTWRIGAEKMDERRQDVEKRHVAKKLR